MTQLLHQPGPPTTYVTRPTNGMAIAALITALLGLAVIPIVLGHLALGQIRRRDEGGGAMAVIGLVLGYGTLVLYLVFAAVTIWAIWYGTTRG